MLSLVYDKLINMDSMFFCKICDYFDIEMMESCIL